MQSLEVLRPQSQASTARLSEKSAEGRDSLSSPKSTNADSGEKIEESEIEHQVETPVTAIPIDKDSKPNANDKGNEEEDREKDKEVGSPLMVQLPTLEKESTDNPQPTQSPQPDSESSLGGSATGRSQQDQTSDKNQDKQTPVEETVNATNVCNLQNNPTEQGTPELTQQTPTPIPPPQEIVRTLSSEGRNIETPDNSTNVSVQENDVGIDRQTENQDEDKSKSGEINDSDVSIIKPISPIKEVSRSSLSENSPTEDTNDSADSSTKPISPNKEVSGSPLGENNPNTEDTNGSVGSPTKSISSNKEVSGSPLGEKNPNIGDTNESAVSPTKSISSNKELSGSPLEERQGTPAIEVA